jgi:hypothetical protein
MANGLMKRLSFNTDLLNGHKSNTISALHHYKRSIARVENHDDIENVQLFLPRMTRPKRQLTDK